MSSKLNASSGRRMESELRKLGRNLDEFVAKTHRAQAAARVKYAGELRLLRARQQQAKKVLARMRRRGTAAGDPLKAGVRKAWSDLTAAVREASKRYRETS